jgi:transcriptional regulator with GAF, ATPase, and Fis domain
MSKTATASAYDRFTQAEDSSETGNAPSDASSGRLNGDGGMIGSSRALQEIVQQVSIVGPTDATALILGETGTGKELIASLIHELSGRRNHAFVKVNCTTKSLFLCVARRFSHAALGSWFN